MGGERDGRDEGWRRSSAPIVVPWIQAGLHLGWVCSTGLLTLAPSFDILSDSSLLSPLHPTTFRRHHQPSSPDASTPTPHPKFLGLGNQNTLAPNSSHFFLPP